MFPMHWWPVLCVSFFRLIPFASTAPTDGTRLHTQNLGLTLTRRISSPLSSIILRAFLT